MSEPTLTGKECRRAVYCLASDKRSDILFVKEIRHYSDGSMVPHINMIPNHPRDFYITKEGYRQHKDKKEWELLTRLQKFTCPQHELVRRAAIATQNYGAVSNQRSLGNSPYLYNTDVSTESIVKYQYQTKYPNAKSPEATVSALDIETSVLWPSKEILMVANVFNDTVVLPINKRFLENRGIANPIERIVERTWELLGDVLRDLGVKHIIPSIEDSPALCVKKAIAYSHEWKPDFMSIWNSHFDIPRMVEALQSEGYDPADVFSDPNVPKEYRFFRYIEGAKTQITASGVIKNLADYDRWHKCTFPATFFPVDSMAVYKTIRTAKGNEPDYKLEGVTQRNLGYGKLNFAEVDKLDGLAWHREMQRNYPIEYCSYAIMDVLVLLALDRKTKDLASAFPVLCDLSRFEDFKQNPLKIVDDMHFFALEKGYALAARPTEVETELDKYVVEKNDWIVTLSSTMMANEGISIFDLAGAEHYKHDLLSNELSGIHGNVLLNNDDIDVAATYPELQDKLNMSRSTTKHELYMAGNLDDMARRRFGVNFVCGEINAIRTCQEGLLLPGPDELLARFREKHGILN
jgi:hypothetical protein